MEINKRPKILVVGGSGFIGGAIVRHAVSRGWDVHSLGLSIPSQESQLENVHYLQADIRAVETLEAISSMEYEYVVNTGGYINHIPFFDGGNAVVDAHFSGVINLVNSINRTKLVRFVNIGSSDEYGDASAPQSESLRESPISPYSFAKTAASHFLQMLYRTEGFPSVTLRLFLCYGPGQDKHRFLPYLISQCLEDSEIETSAGEQFRDYCYIDDVVEGVFCALEKTEAVGNIYNIASGRPIAIKNVVKKVVEILKSGKPNFGAVGYRSGENMSLYADVRKAEHELGWVAKTSLDEGMVKTIEYYSR
ncbi:MAG: NAD-dependent epimerase/dehydratase family protein [Porticoccaceae bacterium]|nr:NAD-dependent epimerase/dehydratase family protein [Porticoccaceae bacterium]